MIHLYLKIPEEFGRLIHQDRFGLCIYHLFVWSNFNFLHNSQWISLPTQSRLLFTLSELICCIHLLYDWSCRLCHYIVCIFCFVASYLGLIWLVRMALFCVVIRRDSVSLLRFPFLSYVHVFSCEMSLVSRLKRSLSFFSSHFFSCLLSFRRSLCR